MTKKPSKTNSRRTRTVRETPLQRFLDARRIPSAAVERKAGVSRQQMARWRLGRSDIRRKYMVRVLGAVREVANDPNVMMEDLFDLTPDNPDNWTD